ncbi:MAG TPA: HD domain-containing protein [Anaerolineae bacterium]|nr:HD domain-containing protein [Anaerolineae bacterium]
MGLLDEAIAYAEEEFTGDDMAHMHAVASYARVLAQKCGADEEIVTIAAYLHDISQPSFGGHEHNVKSAEMATEFLRKRGYPEERIKRVAAAIRAHMHPVWGEDRATVPLEGQVLYDADKMGWAMGLCLVFGLINLGAAIPDQELTYRQVARTLEKAKAALQRTYRSLYTDAAKELAADGYHKALAFCDSLLALGVFLTNAFSTDEV